MSAGARVGRVRRGVGLRRRSPRAAVLLGVVSAAMRVPLPGRPPRSATVVLAPSAPGSVGDHAMLSVLAEQLPRTMVLMSQATDGHRNEKLPGTRVVLMGELFGRPPLAAVRAALRVGRALARAERFYVVGADVMDGAYSAWRSELRFGLASIAATRMPASIINTSWNEAPHPTAVRALRRSKGVRIVARDCVSAARLRADGDRDVDTSADLAFLYVAVKRPPGSVPLWLAAQAERSRPVVAVNLNASVASPQRLVDIVAPACRWLLDSGHALLLVSHDERGGDMSDLAVMHALNGRLGVSDATLVWQAPAADEMSWVLQHVSFAVSCRMHLIVLAATVGVPSIGFEYQGKMTGLFDEHFGAADRVLDLAQAGADDVLAVVAGLAKRRDDAARSLFDRLAVIRVRAGANL
jgi:polysaccharide pyruvyl transferase WcaK-like protein